MSLTVGSILQLGLIRDGALIAGGGGLGRKVDSVTVLDAPDAVQWLRGRELALTSTYPLLALEDKLHFLVEELVERKAGGLGVKLNRYMKVLPERMVERANELRFPLVAIPSSLAWIEVIRSVMERIMLPQQVGDETGTGGLGHAIEQILLADAGLSALADALHRLVENPVIIYNAFDGASAFAPACADETAQAAVSAISNDQLATEIVDATYGVRRRHGTRHPITFIDFLAQSELSGYVAIVETERPVREEEVRCLVHTRGAIIAKLLQLKAELSMRWQNEDEMLRLLLAEERAPAPRIDAAARTLGLAALEKERYTVVVLKAAATSEPQFHALIRNLRGPLRPESSILAGITSPKTFVMLFPVSRGDGTEAYAVTERVRALLETFSPKGADPAIAAGVSQPTGLGCIRSAYQQAEQVLDYGLETRPGELVHRYDRLGIYNLLANSEIQDELEEFVENWIRPILDVEQERGSELAKTLKVFLECHGNYRDAARRLRLHHNTVRYRIRQVEALTGHSVLEPEISLQYRLALALHMR